MRHSPRFLLFAVFVLSLVLAGCSMEDEVTAPPVAKSVNLPAGGYSSPGLAMINGYIVRYEGREYDDGFTTFSYTVIADDNAPYLDSFFLEVPECTDDPTCFFPDDESGFLTLDHTFGLYGVKWYSDYDLYAPPRDREFSVEDLGSAYSVTYEGDVPEGVIYAVVNAGEGVERGTVYGPCAGNTVSGTVFVDTDGDGYRDPGSEPGLADVIVELVGQDAMVDTVRTDEFGFWSFVRRDSLVTVRVDLESYGDAANGQLADFYYPTTDLERMIYLTGEYGDVDFGFAPNTQDIIYAIEEGVIPTDGEDLKFWRKQFKRALFRAIFRCKPGHGPRAVYDYQELQDFLNQIEGLYFEDPYQFRDRREVWHAFMILLRRPRTEVQELRQELLVTELNHVAGLGLMDEYEGFQGGLISWGESLVIQAETENLNKADPAVVEGIRVFRAINTTGGGGIIDD